MSTGQTIPPPEARLAADVLTHSNLRLCEGTASVRAVVPFPGPDQAWAPASVCGDTFERADALLPTPELSGGVDGSL